MGASRCRKENFVLATPSSILSHRSTLYLAKRWLETLRKGTSAYFLIEDTIDLHYYSVAMASLVTGRD